MKEHPWSLHVFFNRNCREVPVSPEDTLASILLERGYPLTAPCGGKGLCGKCRLRAEGPLSPPDPEEIRLLGDRNLRRGIRLACRCKILGNGVEVWLEEETEGRDDEIFGKTGDLSGKILSEEPDTRLVPETPTKSDKDRVPNLCGAVFDLGTTTLGCFLYDLSRKNLLGYDSARNPQTSRGADLLTRLVLAEESEEARKSLQDTLLESLEELLLRVLRKAGIPPRYCTEILCLGNSGMHHLFFGLSCASLLKAPFRPFLLKGLEEPPGGPLAKRLLPQARLRSLPLIGGFVGGDFLGALYSLKNHPSSKPRMLIDLGTNGEMGLLWQNRILAASAAAGPAFEGGNISRGTWARKGAVSGIKIRGNRLVPETLGDAPPLGICGSGLLDLLEVLLRGRGMDRQGRLASFQEVFHPALREGLLDSQGLRSFRFALSESGESLELTQQDIREFQLAKGALRGGMELLLERAELSWEDLEEVLLAGTFGTFIRREAALEVGLFPRSMESRITSLGNAAAWGGGAVLLGGPSAWEEIIALRNQVEHCSLDDSSRFQELFLKFLNFES